MISFEVGIVVVVLVALGYVALVAIVSSNDNDR